MAVHNNQSEVARKLLENPAIDVNDYRPAHSQQPVLHDAAGFGYLNTARMLLRHGADVNLVYVKEIMLDGEKVLFRNTTALNKAVGNNKTEMTKVLLMEENILNIDALDAFCGCTPLMGAAVYDNLPLLELLLQAGADVNFTSDFGFTAIHNAVASNSTKVVRFLLDRGANVNVMGRGVGYIYYHNYVSDRVDTPLFGAMDSGNKEMVSVRAIFKQVLTCEGHGGGSFNVAR